MSKALRRVVIVLSLGLLVPALPAHAGPSVDRAAAALARDAVYVDPDAVGIVSTEDAGRLRQRIAGGNRAVFVAVLPGEARDETGGSTELLVSELSAAVGKSGTYAVVAGNQFRAGSTTLPRGRAGELATLAFQAHRERGVTEVLLDFIGRVQADNSAVTGPSPQRAPADSADEGSFPLIPVLLVGGGAVFGGLWWRRRRQQQAEVDQARRRVDAEVSLLGQEVVELETRTYADPEAARDYVIGVDRYRWAQATLPEARTVEELADIRRAVIEGRYAMARARAEVDGHPPPPPPDELRRAEPVRAWRARDVEDDDDDWDGRWRRGGYFGGGGGGGLLTGLFLGGMLGGGFGRRDTVIVNDNDGSGGEGPDSGGGDFGGGDFDGDGGGDF